MHINGGSYVAMEQTSAKFAVGGWDSASTYNSAELGTGTFPGTIAEVIIFDERITHEEVMALYCLDPYGISGLPDTPDEESLETATDRLKSMKVHLYGSFIRRNTGIIPSAREDMTTDSVTMPIGLDGPALDQFDVSDVRVLSGTFSDRMIYENSNNGFFGGIMLPPIPRNTLYSFLFNPGKGSIASGSAPNTFSRGVIGSVISGDAGSTGSINRFVKLHDFSRVYSDSCVPPYGFLMGTKYFGGLKDRDSASAGTNSKLPYVRVTTPNAGYQRNLILSNNPISESYGWFRSFAVNLDSLYDMHLVQNNSELAAEENTVFSKQPAAKTHILKDGFQGVFGIPGVNILNHHLGMLDRFPDGHHQRARLRIGGVLQPNSFLSSPKIVVDLSRFQTTSSYKKFSGTEMYINGIKGVADSAYPNVGPFTRFPYSGIQLAARNGIGFPWASYETERKAIISMLMYGATAGINKVKGPMPVRKYDDIRAVLELRGFRYGLKNAIPQLPSNIFRRDSFGQFRDMLEQAPETSCFTISHGEDEGEMTRRFKFGMASLDPPVKIKFVTRTDQGGGAAARGVEVDADQTNSQNLSQYSTSSVPYIDGYVTDRFTPQPDALDDFSVEFFAEQTGGIRVDEDE